MSTARIEPWAVEVRDRMEPRRWSPFLQRKARSCHHPFLGRPGLCLNLETLSLSDRRPFHEPGVISKARSRNNRLTHCRILSHQRRSQDLLHRPLRDRRGLSHSSYALSEQSLRHAGRYHQKANISVAVDKIIEAGTPLTRAKEPPGHDGLYD